MSMGAVAAAAAEEEEDPTTLVQQIVVELPTDTSQLVIHFSTDVPPRVEHLSGLGKHRPIDTVVGSYLTSLRFWPDDIEVTNIREANQLYQLLNGPLSSSSHHITTDTTPQQQQQQQRPPQRRQLVFCSHPPPVYPDHEGCYYALTNLPNGVDLGLTLTGFPAEIAAVAPTSPLYGKVQPHQLVQTVLTPGLDPSELSATTTPGFTGPRVQAHLEASNHITATVGGVQNCRALIVKDLRYDPYIKSKTGRREVPASGQHKWFDFF